MKQFQELHQAVSNDRRYSPWSKERTLSERVQMLHEEVQEVLQALGNEDLVNLKEELGDVIWDAVAVAVIAEEKGLFSTEEVLHDVVDKFKQRKPWIFKDIPVSIKEESRLWIEAKKKEKQ